MMMQWSIEKWVGKEIVKKKVVVMADAFEKLIVAKDDTRGASRISLGYGESTEFAREKYNIQITLTHDQNEDKLNKAFELGMETLKRLSTRMEEELSE